MSRLRKALGYLGLQSWFEASRNDGNNFVTNRVSLAQFQDSGASSENRAMALSAVWACVRLVAGTISSLPLELYRSTPEGRMVAKDHALYRILHNKPNSDQTALNFWQFMSASVELQGNGFSEIARSSDGRVVAILPPFAPESVQPKRASNGSLAYEITAGSRRTLGQDSVLHIRGFGGGPLGGMSTLAYASSAIGLASAMQASSAAMFRNGVQLSGYVQTDESLTEEQRREAETLINQQMAGADNVGVARLFDRGMKFQPLSINPDDAQMLESRQHSVEEICRYFGVPPHMIGHSNTTTWGSGIEQMTIGFVQFTLRERLKNIESTLEAQLLSPAERAEGMRIEFNLEGLLRGDSESRTKFYESGLSNKWMTINEVRAKENMLPVEWGNEPWGQMQDVQLGDAPQPSVSEGDLNG